MFFVTFGTDFVYASSEMLELPWRHVH